MIAMPRSRPLYLVLLMSLAALSYLSFDTFIRPVIVGLPSPASLPTVKDGVGTITLPNSKHLAPPPSILLVSAFFPLSHSKHSMSDYQRWLSNFLQPITTPIYFFTTPDMEPFIRKLRGNLPITINTSYVSPFDIPPLSGMVEKYEEMWHWDRERRRHSPELYAVWAGKPFFLDEGLRNAVALLPPSHPRYKYAFWTDAGSFRDPHKYTAWPDPTRVEEVWEEGSRESGTKQDDLLFSPMWSAPHTSMQFWGPGMGPIDNEFSEGSFFGGTPSTISWWRDLYFTYHDYYLSQDVFVGKDRTLMNALFLLHPKRIISVWLLDPSPPSSHPGTDKSALSLPRIKRSLFGTGKDTPLGLCGSTWFYYQFFLASAEEREKMRHLWGNSWGFKPWSLSWWLGKTKVEGDGKCRLTRVVAMELLLKRVFGKGWSTPRS